MITALISASTFLAGLFVGYALCVWQSRRVSGRSVRQTPITTFGHARRAF